MTGRRTYGLVIAALTMLVACRPLHASTGDVSPDRLLALERARDARTASPHELAELAASTWLTTGSLERTDTALKSISTLATSDDLAAFVSLFVARERLREDAAVEAALALVRGHPRSPLTEVAAARLQEFSGISQAVDDRIEAALAPLETRSLELGGYAAFRARSSLLAVRDARQEEEAAARVRASMGVATTWTVIGPLGASRLENIESAPALAAQGPLGPISPRPMPTPDGVLSVKADPWRADLYEALADLRVDDGGDHLVAFAGVGEAKVWIDGVLTLTRTAHPRRAPDRSWAAVRLEPGSHRVRVVFTKTDGDAFSLSLPRVDARPSRLSWSASRTSEAEPKGRVTLIALPADARQTLEAQSSAGQGGAVTTWASILAAISDDAEAARARLPLLVSQAGETPSIRALRLDLTAWDPELPPDVQRLVAARESQAILAAEPSWSRAWLNVFDRQREEKRTDDALKTLDRLASLADGAPVFLARTEVLRARLLHDLGDAEGVRRASSRALELDPGRCDAAEVRFSQARREDDLRTSDALSSLLSRCKEGDGARAALARSRGRLEDARRLFEKIAAKDPTEARHREALAELQVAEGDLDGARRSLETISAHWPHRAETWRRIARVEELRGRSDEARAMRRRAATIDASDIASMRLVSLDEGHELLDWAARDGGQSIRAYLSSGVHSKSYAVQVLDLAASEWQPDGSMLERVHSIVRVLDKRGIDRFGEVTIPQEAQAIAVRTVKPDGTRLDAETIDGKSSISLPNLEPGDFVEYEYVRASGPRVGLLPGFAAGQFLFESTDLPVFESVHLVRTPASGPKPEWDGERLEGVQGPVRKGDFWEWSYAHRRMDPLVRESLSPSDAELLPWAEVGTGPSTADAMRMVGEWISLRARPNAAVDAFVAGCLALPPNERVAEVVRRVRGAMQGPHDGRDFSSPAAILARQRGNRLVLLLASLEACRVPAHLVAARPFAANPHAFRFPHGEVYSAWLVRAEPSDGPPVWIDPAMRDALVNVLEPELSRADAYVLPRPGEAPMRVQLPEIDPRQDLADDRYEITLGPDGAASGEFVRTAHGTAAGWFRRFLEEIAPDELRKAEEQRLSTVLRGAAITHVAPALDDDLSRTTMRARFTVEAGAMVSGGRIEWPASISSDRLSRRLLSRGERRTPLVLSDDEASSVTTIVRLPQAHIATLPKDILLDGPYGSFSLQWRRDGDRIVGEESLTLHHQRVPPEKYAAFARFIAAIDEARSAVVVVASSP